MSRTPTGWMKVATATVTIGTLALAGCRSSDDSTATDSAHVSQCLGHLSHPHR